MASWTNIANALIAIKAPITYVIGRQLRDNPIAIAEGAVGAPRVVVPTALSTAETDISKELRPNGSGGVQWVSSLTPCGNSADSSSATSAVWLPLGPEGGTYIFSGHAYGTSGGSIKTVAGSCTGVVVSAVGSITSFRAIGNVSTGTAPGSFTNATDTTSTAAARITSGIVEVNIGGLCRTGSNDTTAVVNWTRVS
jgi:hypothetical protein